GRGALGLLACLRMSCGDPVRDVPLDFFPRLAPRAVERFLVLLGGLREGTNPLLIGGCGRLRLLVAERRAQLAARRVELPGNILAQPRRKGVEAAPQMLVGCHRDSNYIPKSLSR